MYRINLYRERETRGQERRRGILRAGLFGVVLGLEVVLVGFLVVSGLLIGEKSKAVESSLANIRSRIEATEESPELRASRTLVHARVQRIDWATVLDAVARSIPDDVTLKTLEGGFQHVANQRPGLDLEGGITDNRRQLESVVAFVDSLRAEPRLTRVFPRIDLETVETERTKIFRIVCRPVESES